MPVYHPAPATAQSSPATEPKVWIRFTAAVPVKQSTVDFLTDKLAAAHATAGTRWRKLDSATQATLVIAFLRTNLTYRELAAGHAIALATCWRYIDEGLRVLAGRAIRLREVLRLARKKGWEYLLVDGTLISTVAFGRKITPKQKHFSGKHRQHGVNVQTVCAPDTGTLLWASAALPGNTHDITAYRRHQLEEKLSGRIGVLADLGYKGLDNVATGVKKPRGGQLTDAQQAANALHAGLRSPGERGNAQLKWWKVLATELRCRPRRCTLMIKACLTLHHLENAPFADNA